MPGSRPCTVDLKGPLSDGSCGKLACLSFKATGPRGGKTGLPSQMPGLRGVVHGVASRCRRMQRHAATGKATTPKRATLCDLITSPPPPTLLIVERQFLCSLRKHV